MAPGRAVPILHRHCGYSKAFQDSDEEKMHYQNGQGERGGRDLRAKGGSRWEPGLGWEGGAHKDQSPRDRQQDITETRGPKGAVQFPFRGFTDPTDDARDPPPGKRTRVCAHTQLRIQPQGGSCVPGQDPLLERVFSGPCRDPRKQSKYRGCLPPHPTSVPRWTLVSVMVLVPIQPECSLRILLNTVV